MTYKWELAEGSEFMSLEGDTDKNEVTVQAKESGYGILKLTVSRVENDKTVSRSTSMEIKVDGIESIDPYVTATEAGTAPILPKMVVAPVANNTVTFENVQLEDNFWNPKQKVNAVNSLNKAIAQIEQPSGGEPNFENAIKKLNGEQYDEFQGFVFLDSDIYKSIEAISYTLSVIQNDSDPEMVAQKAVLEKKLAEWISLIEQVQYSDGSEKEIPMEETVITGYNPETIGKQQITVSYQGKTASFMVRVDKNKAEINKELSEIKPEKETAVKTGDYLFLEMWLLLLCVSGGGVVLHFRRKNR